MGIINFIGLLALIYMFVKGAAPIQFIKRLAKVHNDSEPKKLWLQLIQKLVNCSMCFGFWTGLVYYWFLGVDNYILMGCIVSLSAELFTRIIDHIFNLKWKI